MQARRVIIVGAGIGGLSCAVGLAARGIDVVVLEQRDGPGGKMRQVEVDGFPIDAGPTVLTMRWVFDELFESAGDRLSRHVRLTPAEVLARHAWTDGSRLDLYADKARSEDAIGKLAGAAAVSGYRRFCTDAARIYRILEHTFLRRSRPTPFGLARRYGLLRFHHLLALSPFEILWRRLGAYFPDGRLRQLFGRYATYCGSSPLAAPATLMLVAHVEQEGVWYVDGGMHGIARALSSFAGSLGASIRYGAGVREICVEGNAARGVVLETGERLHADAIISNADPSALGSGVLGRAASAALSPIGERERSLSAMTWCLRARVRGFPLGRHNIFFSDDYEAEFRALCGSRTMPEAPTIYLCAQDRDDAAPVATESPERLFCLINAPARADDPSQPAGNAGFHARHVLSTLERFGLHIDTTLERAQSAEPRDFQGWFGCPGGALYGRASHGWRATFRRSGARTRIPGLYLTGGGTHPGPGVPLAALSGRQAVDAVVADFSSTRRAARGGERD